MDALEKQPIKYGGVALFALSPYNLAIYVTMCHLVVLVFICLYDC